MDSLAAGKMHSSTKRKSSYYFSLFYINECFDQIFYNKRVFFSIVNVSRSAMLSGVNIKITLNSVNKWYKKVAILLGYPVSKMWILLNPED